ncbi:hypothetical protein [Candidiatus Paracoxiella cheracis]|uniref:hypothetical protein n=1 Tax=Candidiatus Paracoxiella cheracis TaxID=3405120 RepID=UPI003BF4F624
MSRSSTPPANNDNDLTERLLRTSVTTVETPATTDSSSLSSSDGQQADGDTGTNLALAKWMRADPDLFGSAHKTTYRQYATAFFFMLSALASCAVCYPLGKSSGDGIDEEIGTDGLGVTLGLLSVFVVSFIAVPVTSRIGLLKRKPEEFKALERKKTWFETSADIAEAVARLPGGLQNAYNTAVFVPSSYKGIPLNRIFLLQSFGSASFLLM